MTKMMVTITSMKKIQEPDLLLDQPRHHRLTNNLNKPHRSGIRHSPKSRKQFYSEDSGSSISTTTTLTSISASNCDESSPVTNEGDTVINVDENTRWSKPNKKNRSTHSTSQSHPNSVPTRVCIRTKTKASSNSNFSPSGGGLPTRLMFNKSCTTMSKKQLIVLLISTFILVSSVVTLLILLLTRSSHTQTVSSSSVSNSDDIDGIDSNSLISNNNVNIIEENSEEEEAPDVDSYDYGSETSLENHSSNSDSTNNNLDLKEVSRLSWNMLNSNQERVSGKDSNSVGGNVRNRYHNQKQVNLVPSSFSGISGGEEVVLPSKMIFSDKNLDSTNLSPNSSGENGKNKKRSCCRTQKYSQVIKRDGCEPLTITNRMCFGQCVSVWVPGLFASFPVCKPSRSSWKTVMLTCGKNRDRKRRVRIEKVRRCSCMEIEPTAPSLTNVR